MTTNPIQPAKGNRDEATQRAGAQPPSGPSATSRDEGSRSFRSGSDATPAVQARTGGSSEILRCLDSIEENVSKVRTALSASGREGAGQSAERQSTQSSSRTSHADSDESSGERNRDASNRL